MMFILFVDRIFNLIQYAVLNVQIPACVNLIDHEIETEAPLQDNDNWSNN